MLNKKGVMKWLVTEERRVLTRSLHTVPEVHILFNLQNIDWMARDFDNYSEEIVQMFYASYISTFRGSINRQKKSAKQDPLTSTWVWGCRFDISKTTICRFLYGPTIGSQWILNTSEFSKFHYRWEIVQSGEFKKSAEKHEAVKKWLALYLPIKKDTLTFEAMFFLLFIPHWLSPTKADNVLTWDREVMVEALVAGL